jgi:PAS domain S-box-containing protein
MKPELDESLSRFDAGFGLPASMVSGEMALDGLVETLLGTAIEQAGAERGLLILPHGGELSIQAEGKACAGSVTVRLRETPVSAHELPESLVRHAARTQENVILDDALARNPFSSDEYIRERRPRSVLCLPLVRQGALVALLYMENNLGPGFFSSDRIVVLKVLASQAAISLDNSRLYRELQEREGRIRRLVDANIIGILISDSEGRIIESNDAYLKMVGYTREELVSGRIRWRDMTPAEWKEVSEQGVVQVRTTGACKAFEKEYYRKDGSRVPVLVGAARFEKNSIVAFAVDLTELKRAEAQRREHLWFLESMDRINRAMQRTNDFELMMTGVVQEALAIFGCDRAWLVYPCDPDSPTIRAVMEHTSPEYPGAFALGEDLPVDTQAAQALRHVLDGPGAVTDLTISTEIRERFTIESMIAIAVRPKGDRPYLFGLHQCSHARAWTDAERRLFEEIARRLEDALTSVLAHRNLLASREELRQSKAYLAEAQKLSQTGSWAWSPEGHITYWSEECYRVLGFDPQDGLPRSEEFFQRIHPDDLPAFSELAWTAVRENAQLETDYRIVHPDGSVRVIHVVGGPVLSKSGDLVVFVGTVIDITDRKRAEEERREHLWFLESMDRINRAMQRTDDLEGMLSGVLEETLAIFGSDRARLVYPCDPDAATSRVVMEHSRPEYPGASALGEDVPMDRHAVQFVRRVLDSPGAATDLSTPEVRERFRIQSAIAIAVHPKGDSPYLFGLHQCSHARAWTAAERRLFEEIARRLEDALTSVLAHRSLLASQEQLRRSRAYLAEAQKVSHTGSWAWSPVSNAIVYWSEECYRILGHDPAEGLPSFAQLMEDVHPEDRVHLADTLEKAVGARGDLRVEYRLANFADGPRSVRCMAHPILDGSGQVLEYVGTVMDITEQKRAEEERRAHVCFLESMDRINRAMQRTNDVELMTSGVVQEALEIFACDRVALNYPCDPDSPTFRTVMEHASPEYKGPLTLGGGDRLVSPEGAELLRRCLHASGAVVDPILPPAIRERFGVASMLAIAIRPKGDRPYMLGVHCARSRSWTGAELRLFEEIARRLEDVLTSVLAHRKLLASQEELRASEQRFRTFVDQATDAVFLYDNKHIVRDVNRQACETTGYTREELIGMHVSQLNPDVTPEMLESQWGRLLERGTTTQTGLRRRKDGSVFPVELRARVFDRGGRLFAIALAIDITERRRREQRLLAQYRVTQILSERGSLEEAVPRILHAMCDALEWEFGALWHADAQEGLLRCLDAWPLETDFEREARKCTFMPGVGLPGKVWTTGVAACVRDLELDPTPPCHEFAAKHGIHASLAFPIRSRTGVLAVMQFFSRGVRDAEGELLQMTAAIGFQLGEFIERTRAEEALRAARSELAHVTRVMSMGELTASIAHEVNQPLGAMVTSAASASRWLAANPPNLQKAWLALARIAVDGERASAVIDRMRMLIKRQEPGREPIDVNETILSVVALMRDEMERAGVAHAVRLADNLPRVLSDRVLLQQVILNLILNAIDAMRGVEDRARVLRIESRLDKQDEVRVEVRDTGRGLPPDARLFEAFYTTKERGLGMGLSISRSIVEAHGGRMQARPNEPHGAVFEFSLPAPQV